MTEGDEVIVIGRVLDWGVGTIKRITLTGHLVIGFDDGTVDAFHSNEVQLTSEWAPPVEKQAA
jgi:hypothetical protein